MSPQTSPPPSPPDAPPTSATAFAETIRRRNLRESIAALIVEAWAAGRVGLALFRGEVPGTGTWVGLGLLTGAVLLIVGVLRTRGRPDPDAPLSEQLATQARLLSWAPVWYALPLAVGGTAYAGGLLADRGQSLSPTVIAVVWGVCALVGLLNLWAAGKLRALARAT